MDLSAQLHHERVKAAEASGGTSSNAVYSAIERVIESENLTGDVLDYGAGIGDFTRRLLRLGRFTSVSAIDILPKPAEFDSLRWIQQDLNEPIEGYEGAFDVVIAAEVIEHLENPRFTVRQLARLVKGGGTLILSTPNNESWRSLVALVARGHYVYFGDSSYPAHITALLRKDFSRILAESKLTAPNFYFTDHGGIPGHPTLTWQQVSLGLLRGLRFSDNVIAVARKPR